MAFHLNAFQTPQDFKTRLAVAPKVRAPRSTEDVRVRSDWCVQDVLMAKFENKFYLVAPSVAEMLAGRLFQASLYATASSKGEVFLWPVKLGTSAVEAAQEALDKWKNIAWDNPARAYVATEPEAQHNDPVWRYADFDQLCKMAFAGKVLDDPEMPLVKQVLATASGK
jgi:hypothetical protein